MKKIDWKNLFKSKKAKKFLIGGAIALVVIAAVVTAAVLLDAGTVKLVNADEAAGRVQGGGRIPNGSSTTIRAIAKDGYAFVSWTNPDGTVASTEAEHTMVVPKSTIELTANWKVVDYEIVLHLNSDSNVTTYPATVNIKDEDIFLDAPTKEGYTFLGWYKDAELTEEAEDYIPAGTTAKVELYARWALSYAVNYDLNLAGASNNPENPATYTEFKDVELKHPVYYQVDESGKLTGGTYRFLRWEDAESGATVTKLDKTWKRAVNLRAVWDTSKIVYYTSYEKNGATYVEFGRYPQHILEDKRTISDLKAGIAAGTLVADESGMYSYQNTLYVKVKATPYQNDAKTYFGKFSDGSDVKAGEEYFFVVEPIVWKVIAGDISVPNSELQLLAESVLSAQVFRKESNTREFDGLPVYANNWEYSDLRAFLNGEFLNTAFMTGEKTFLQTKTVDYSKETVNTDNAYQRYANGDNCEDTVFLMSYADMFDTQYGWTPSKYKETDFRKTAKATDYAKALGVYASVNGDEEHDNAHWWLRSNGESEVRVAVTTALGRVGTFAASGTAIGVRPTIVVKFN